MTISDLALRYKDFAWLRELLKLEDLLTPKLKECELGFLIYFENKICGIIDNYENSLIINSGLTVGEVEYIVIDLFEKKNINDNFDLIIMDEVELLELV